MSNTQHPDSISEIKAIRRRIVEMLHSSGAGHLGSSMSIVEMLYSAYSVSNIKKILGWERDRDVVIVSKGHAAASTYAVMNHFGLISAQDLMTYHQPDSNLLGHVSHDVPYVEHSTGALGHGLSVGLGRAIFQKNHMMKSRTMVICGDGEIQEGSIWEALMLASTKKVNNLILMVDVNKISSIKGTESIISTGSLKSRFEGFGLRVLEVDGHSVEKLSQALKTNFDNISPLVILCDTVKGKGISFAENQAIWHYRTLSAELYADSLGELR